MNATGIATKMNAIPDLMREDEGKTRAGDVLVGILVALLSASNLAQGAWTNTLPWLNLTAISLIILLPIASASAIRLWTEQGGPALFLLAAALGLGYMAPELTPSAGEKRIGIVLGVFLPTLVAFLVLNTDPRRRWFLRTLVVLAALVALLQRLGPDPVAASVGRLTPVGLNAIGAGRLLGAGVVVLLATAIVLHSTPKRSMFVVLALPLTVGLLASGSRGAVLGVIVACAASLAMASNLTTVKRILCVITGVVVAAFSWVMLDQEESRLVIGSDTGRGDLYRAAWNVVTTQPLGIGWGNLYDFLPAWVISSEQGWNQYAHNVVLEVFVESGWMAGALFIAFLVTVARRCFSARNKVSLVLSSVGLFAFVGALFSSDIVGNRLLWVVCGALLNLTVSERSKE